MNFLAHIQLACHSDQAMLGAFLGDFVGPEGARHLGAPVAEEIQLHRAVDRYTDSHPLVRETRQLCQPANRLFARIALDVYYDYFLTKHWHRHCSKSIDSVVDRFYDTLSRRFDALPEKARRVGESVVSRDWLRSYSSHDQVSHAVARIALRLSRKRQHLIDAMAELRAQSAQVEAGFVAFYPQLQRHIGEMRWRQRSLKRQQSG